MGMYLRINSRSSSLLIRYSVIQVVLRSPPVLQVSIADAVMYPPLHRELLPLQAL